MQAENQPACKRMTPLAAVVRAEIVRGGPVSFARFMDLALYHADLGYYERAPRPVGRQGDFYTSVSVGPLFGQLLAYQFARWCDQLGPGPLQWLEAGAHNGQLAGDMLEWLRAWRPDLLARLEYWILEPSARRRGWQQTTLAGLGLPVRWFGAWADLPAPGVRGVIFANELLDALPVHRLGWDARAGGWFEWGVDCREDSLIWTRLAWDQGPPVLGLELSRDFLGSLPEGFTLEVCPAALEWWTQAARRLAAGRLLTLDYGLSAEQLLAPERHHGTLRAYFHHHVTADLLSRVGEQDLTAHVNFTALERAGGAAGLGPAARRPQAAFFTRLVEGISQRPDGFAPWDPGRRRQLQTLIHPDYLGRALEVFIQNR